MSDSKAACVAAFFANATIIHIIRHMQKTIQNELLSETAYLTLCRIARNHTDYLNQIASIPTRIAFLHELYFDFQICATRNSNFLVVRYFLGDSIEAVRLGEFVRRPAGNWYFREDVDA